MVYILMATPPSAEGDFVEVEDADGHGISLGRWVRLGRFYALEIHDPRSMEGA